MAGCRGRRKWLALCTSGVSFIYHNFTRIDDLIRSARSSFVHFIVFFLHFRIFAPPQPPLLWNPYFFVIFQMPFFWVRFFFARFFFSVLLFILRSLSTGFVFLSFFSGPSPPSALFAPPFCANMISLFCGLGNWGRWMDE